MRTGGILCFLLIAVSTFVNGDENDEKSRTLYKKMIARRREEHFHLLKNVAKNPNYEMRFRLITAGMDKVYEIIKKNRDELEKETEKDKSRITEPKMTIIENTCLLMDFIVNFSFDDMIYKIFGKLRNEHWLGDLLWSMKYLENYVDLLDELSTKEFKFVKENLPNIMNDRTLPEYPHENRVKEFLPSHEQVKDYEKKKKKERSKHKKGPQLADPFKFEL